MDGNDYHIWKALKKFKPKIVCIEYNPTIPTEIRFVQPPDASVNQGASLLSLVELAKEKGYELVSVTPLNAFFVITNYYPLFQIENNSPSILRKSLDSITYLFCGYDGKMFLHGCKKVLWHNIETKENRIQQLPKFLQKYPGNYSKIEKLLLVIHKLITNPHRAIEIIISRLSKKYRD